MDLELELGIRGNHVFGMCEFILHLSKLVYRQYCTYPKLEADKVKRGYFSLLPHRLCNEGFFDLFVI